MSSSDNKKVDPGFATIIGAVIGAIALIVGTIMGTVVGAKSQPIQVFLGSTTPTIVAQPNVLGLPSPQPTYTALPTYTPQQAYTALPTYTPQPTYTVLPTYTPYPTLTPPITIVAPKPITVIPTLRGDQQNPPPGSVILAGQGFTENSISVTARNPLYVESDNFTFFITIQNNSNELIVVSWRNSYIHAKDDTGKSFRQRNQNASDWDQIKQFSIPSGDKREFNLNCYLCYGSVDTIDRFQGVIDPSAKYLVFTIDQMAGMTDMNWRYDIR